MDQRLCHHVTPPANPPLQGAELPVGKLAGVLPLEPLQQRLGGRLGIVLEPQKDLRPNRLKRILPRPPTVRGGGRAPVSRTSFSRTPQLGELGEKRIETFPFRTMTQVARPKRCQSGLGFADLMQELQRIECSQLRSERRLDGGRDRGMSQETVAGSRGLVILLLDLGSL